MSGNLRKGKDTLSEQDRVDREDLRPHLATEAFQEEHQPRLEDDGRRLFGPEMTHRFSV